MGATPHNEGLDGAETRFRNGSAEPRAAKASGGLAGWQVRRAEQLAAAGLRNLTPKSLAQEARLSPYHFARAFRRSMGTSPGKWLTELRITRAKALLSETRLPVDEIARELGYSGTAQLTRIFRARVGATPREFRRR